MNKNYLTPLCILLSAGLVLMSSHTCTYASDRIKFLYSNTSVDYRKNPEEAAEYFAQNVRVAGASVSGLLPYFSVSYEFEDDDSRYRETPLRRFETVFFISLPAGALLSFLGLTAYRAAAGKTGVLLPSEYVYIALSTIGISLSIAAHDTRSRYRKDIY